jgi:hypothetical protein
MVKADFLERARRTSFLLTLAFTVFLGYEAFSGTIVLRLDNDRGLYNSAWVGALMGVVTSSFVTLVGFYIVKGSVLRDQSTRVGQILAATPMSKSFYTLAKALGNFAVLAAMVAVMGLAALLMQMLRGEDRTLHPVALLGPLLFLALPAMAVVASMAVLFETLPVLRGGVGNVAWFFLWTTLLVAGMPALNGHASALSPAEMLHDFTGLGSVFLSTRSALVKINPGFPNDFSLSIGGAKPSATFLWTGIDWTAAQLAARLAWAGMAVLLALLASLFFHRFDPAREFFVKRQRQPATQAGTGMQLPAETRAATQAHAAAQTHASAQAHASAQTLALKGHGFSRADQLPPQEGASAPEVPQATEYAPTTVTNTTIPLRQPALSALPRTAAHANFLPLAIAELRLMLKGWKWWWYAGAAGLFIACLASPLAAGRGGVILAAWLWPLLLWSQMGSRESRFSTRSLLFSAPRTLTRQLPAAWLAGVVVTAATGGGLAIRLLFARDVSGLATWTAAVLFIPSLALALGLWTGGSKFFEALYTVWWYVGPLHHTRGLDFIGTAPASSTPALFALLAALLLAACWTRRRTQLGYA